MDPRDFLTLAENLIVIKNARAAHFRAAIGRAYYATFNLASQALVELGFPPAGSSHGHMHVIRLLQQCGDAALECAGGLLGDLQGSRLKADYELQRVDVEKIKAAQAAVETAYLIFGEIEAFMADGARKAIVAGVLKQRYAMITGRSPA
jgi:hypothetical protein